MLQLRERSAAQAGARGRVLVVNARQQAKLGVREGQKNDFRRRLFEIDRRARVVESVKIAGEEMHGVYDDASCRATRARSRPFWPITTRRLARASFGLQARSK